MVSIAGGCFVSVWPAGGDPVVVDGNVEMPGRGLPADRFGTGVREVRDDVRRRGDHARGHGSVATPGIVPAFGLAHERLRPAALGAAGRARPPRPRAARLPDEPRGRALPVDRRRQPVRDGPRGARPWSPGPTARCWPAARQASNPALADVLDDLADAAARRCSSPGRSVAALVAEMAARRRPGHRRRPRGVPPVVRPAHTLDVGDWTIATNPPPVGRRPDARRDARRAGPPGRLDLGGRDRDPARGADLPRRRSTTSPATSTPTAATCSPRSASTASARCAAPSSTAHISAVDDEGTACAITMSSGYGAGLCIPGTGILLNNCLGEAELNRHGLHAVPPGTRLASNMAPTTGRTADGRSLAIGSPGADRITTALMLVLGQGCLHGADLQHAIDRPRLHLRFGDDGYHRGVRARPRPRGRRRGQRAARPRVPRAAHVLRRRRRRPARTPTAARGRRRRPPRGGRRRLRQPGRPVTRSDLG